MKEIKFAGFEVKGKLSAQIVGSGDVNPNKISPDGMLLETTTKLNMNGIYRFKMSFGEKDIILMAKVTSVLMKGTVKKNNRNVTLYQIAADFVNLKNEHKAFIDDAIERLIEEDIPELDDRIKSAKFHVTD